MKSKLAILSLLAIFAFVPLASAGDHGGCPLKGGDCQGCSKGGEGDCCGEKEGCGCPVLAAIKKKAHFFLDNAQEIGLSEDQVATIKQIKTQAKIAGIQAKAGMEVGKLQLEEKLHANPVDVEGIHAMIDKGMGEMAAGAKQSVEWYAKLKSTLTPEQMTKAKAIWAKKKD